MHILLSKKLNVTDPNNNVHDKKVDIQKVRSLRSGRGGPYSPVFPADFNFLLILMIFNSVLSMNGELTQDHSVDYVKNIYLQPLVVG